MLRPLFPVITLFLSACPLFVRFRLDRRNVGRRLGKNKTIVMAFFFFFIVLLSVQCFTCLTFFSSCLWFQLYIFLHMQHHTLQSCLLCTIKYHSTAQAPSFLQSMLHVTTTTTHSAPVTDFASLALFVPVMTFHACHSCCLSGRAAQRCNCKHSHRQSLLKAKCCNSSFHAEGLPSLSMTRTVLCGENPAACGSLRFTTLGLRCRMQGILIFQSAAQDALFHVA